MIYRTVTTTPRILGAVIKANTRVSGDITAEGRLTTIVQHLHSDMPDYTGPTEITPSQAVQVLSTENTAVRGNIVVNAIPSNYGRVTWDGRRLLIE